MLFKKHCYRNKEQTIGWRKCLHNTHISKGLLSKIFKELLWLNDKNKMEKKIIKDLSAKKYVYGLPVSISKDVAVQSLSCDSLQPHDCSAPGFSVLHDLLHFATVHVHWVGQAISPSHSLPPPSPFAFSFPQYQGLFQWVGSLASGGQSIGASATVLPVNTQGWFPLDWLVWSCSPRNSPEMYTIFIH